MDLDEAVFAGPIKTDLIWESVVRQNASERRGTHKAKNRALVSGGGKKPYTQKGTGRAAGRFVAHAALAARRHRVSAAAAQLRLRVPKKVERGALKAAFMTKLKDGVDRRRRRAEGRREEDQADRGAAEAAGRDRSARSSWTWSSTRTSSSRRATSPACALVASGRLTARDVMDTTRIIATRAAIERLQEVLG